MHSAGRPASPCLAMSIPTVVHRTISRLLEKGMAFSVLATADGIQIFTFSDAYFERCLPDRGRDGTWRFGLVTGGRHARTHPASARSGRLSLRPVAQPGPVRRSCRMDGRGRFTPPHEKDDPHGTAPYPPRQALSVAAEHAARQGRTRRLRHPAAGPGARHPGAAPRPARTASATRSSPESAATSRPGRSSRRPARSSPCPAACWRRAMTPPPSRPR